MFDYHSFFLVRNSYQKFIRLKLLFSFSLALVGTLLAPYLNQRGFAAGTLSLLFAVFPFINIILMPFLGYLGDHLKRRRLISYGLLLEIIALVFYLTASHWVFVVLARLCDAVAASLVSLLLLAKIEDTIKSRQQRGYKTGVYLSFGYVGELIGPLFGAWLAGAFFIRLPFFMAIIILLWLLIGLYKNYHTKLFLLPTKIKMARLSWQKQIKQFLFFRPLKGLAVLGMAMHATNPAIKIFLPLIIINYFKQPYYALGVAMFIYGLGHLFQFWFGKLADYWGYQRTVLLGVVVSAFTFILISYTVNYHWLLLVLFIQGIATSLWNVAAWSLMSDIGERYLQEAQVLTSYFALAKIGALFGFLISSWWVYHYGLHSIFLFNGLVILAAVVYVVAFLNFKHAKTV